MSATFKDLGVEIGRGKRRTRLIRVDGEAARGQYRFSDDGPVWTFSAEDLGRRALATYIETHSTGIRTRKFQFP